MMYLAYALLTLLMFVGIFLIVLILLQRGRGGGLAGSFGGMGGQSAFGTKAGDIFTRVTVVVAVIWIVLACICILVVRAAATGRRVHDKPGDADAVLTAPAGDKDKTTGGIKNDDKVIAIPSPDKANPPQDGEKKPVDAEDKKDDGAVEVKKPAGDDAIPATDKSDAPTEAKEKDKKKPAASENADSKKPE